MNGRILNGKQEVATSPWRFMLVGVVMVMIIVAVLGLVLFAAASA